MGRIRHTLQMVLCEASAAGPARMTPDSLPCGRPFFLKGNSGDNRFAADLLAAEASRR